MMEDLEDAESPSVSYLNEFGGWEGGGTWKDSDKACERHEETIEQCNSSSTGTVYRCQLTVAPYDPSPVIRH